MKSRVYIKKDIHYFTIILEYIQDAIDIKNIKEIHVDSLQKIISNIEVYILIIDFNYKLQRKYLYAYTYRTLQNSHKKKVKKFER